MSYKFTTGYGWNDLEGLAGDSHETIGPKTISIWFFVSELPSAGRYVLWEKTETLDDTNIWEEISIDSSGNLTAQVCNKVGGADTEITLSQSEWFDRVNRWYNFVVTSTYDDPNVTMDAFIDGLFAKRVITGGAKESPPDSYLYVGNNRAQDSPCSGLFIGQINFYTTVLTNFQIYRAWTGSTHLPMGTPLSIWAMDGDMNDALGVASLTPIADYTSHEAKPEPLENELINANPFIDVYTMLWYLIETSQTYAGTTFVPTTLVNRTNRIRYDLGDQDPEKEEIEEADLPEIAIHFSGGESVLRTAADLAHFTPVFNIYVTTGDNRFDRGLGEIIWAIWRALARYPEFDRAAEEMTYVHKINVGVASTGSRAEDEQARAIEGWYLAASLSVELWLSKQQMTLAS